jgi:hypothetical protein
MMLPDLPLDFSKATVVEASFPPRGFRLALEGATLHGRALPKVRLDFEAVANRGDLQEFLRCKHAIRLRKIAGLAESIEDHTQSSWPLKLPAQLTDLRISRAKSYDYGDKALNERFAAPGSVRKDQKLVWFALREKRFKNRDAFPIVCERIHATDGKGKTIAGEHVPPPRSWPPAAQETLAARFTQALLNDDVKSAYELTAKALRRQLPKSKFAQQSKPWRDQAGQFQALLAAGHAARELLTIEVGCNDDEELWSCQSAFSEQIQPCGLVTVFFGRLAQCDLTLIEEDEQLRIGHCNLYG